jgi:DNA-binding transcriptional regulator YiaG
MACPTCGSTEEVRRESVRRVELEGIVADIVSPSVECGKCGLVLAAAGADDGELALAQLLAEVGVGSGEAFRLMRGAVELKARELALLLDVRPETISRWERGVAQVDRAAWIALAAIVDDRLRDQMTTVNRLLAMANPAIPQAPVKLVAPMGPERGRRPYPPIVERAPGKGLRSGRRSAGRRMPRRKSRGTRK